MCPCFDWFPAEICVLTKGKHLATARALTDCQCFSLSWQGFQQALVGFPDVRKDLEKLVQLQADQGSNGV